MVTALELVGLFVILLVNTAVAALLTRFFRVRLKTRWGSAAYTLFIVPVVLVGLTLLLGSVAGPNLGSPTAVVVLTVVAPSSVGVAFDYFWMPSPEEVDVPQRQTNQRSRREL
jgi:fatty acid desaturase